MTLPLISNRPTSWMGRNRLARVGCGPRQFESGGREAARQISLQRNEARWQGGIEGRLGGLVVGDDLERGVPRKRHHLGNDDAFAGGLPPERLEIEITESVLLERALENHAFIERLKSLGVSLALDDFGTGYSSLGSLETREQFERLKSLGVNFAQGYLMRRPVPIDELERQPLVYRSRQDAA